MRFFDIDHGRAKNQGPEVMQFDCTGGTFTLYGYEEEDADNAEFLVHMSDDAKAGSLLDACRRVGDQELLRMSLAVAGRYGGLPSARTYGSILKATTNVEEAWTVWKELANSGFEVGEGEYAAMVCALGLNGDVSASRELFDT